MKKYLSLNLKEQINIEPRFNNLEFIHYYENFYFQKYKDVLNKYIDIKNKHRVIVVRTNNNKYLIIGNNIQNSCFETVNKIFSEIYQELKHIYNDLNFDNFLFINKQNSIFKSNFINIIDSSINFEKFDIIQVIKFINGTLYDFINIYSYTKGINIANRIDCIVQMNFKDSDIIEYLNLSYEKNENLFLFLKYTMKNERIYDLYELNNFLIQEINNRKIPFNQNENNIEFLNKQFLSSTNYDKNIFQNTDFFNDNYLSYIKPEKAKEYQIDHIIPFIIKKKLNSF